jgi:hypothetical protein
MKGEATIPITIAQQAKTTRIVRFPFIGLTLMIRRAELRATGAGPQYGHARAARHRLNPLVRLLPMPS